MKTYNIKYGIGRTKYVVNFHNGEKTHQDGSPFFDIQTFKNKKKMHAFVKDLEEQGYKENAPAVTPKESALKTATLNKNGFSVLLSMIESSNASERKKAKSMYNRFSQAAKDRLIKWYVNFLESDFVTKTSFEEQKKNLEHLFSAA